MRLKRFKSSVNAVCAAALVLMSLACAAKPSAMEAKHGATGAIARSDLLAKRTALAKILEEFTTSQGIPGAILGVSVRDEEPLVLAAGLSDRERKIAMQPRDLLLAGSAGKTFFAALILQLVAEKKLELDDPIERFLGSEPWFARLPSGAGITVRMLLQHTSGLPPFGNSFFDVMVKDPGLAHDPHEGLESILDAAALFAPGQGWSYTDVNYLLLGWIAEKITAQSAYAEIERRLLRPLGLKHVVPSDRKRIAGLVPGYAGAKNPFGGDILMKDGALVFDPHFEWAGGGFATGAGDLARWMADFCEGRAFDVVLLPEVFTGHDAPDLGTGTRYGLGVHIDETRFGRAFGHGGFFPGYSTFVRWYEGPRIALAIQVNTSDEEVLKRSLTDLLDECLGAVLRK